MIELLCHFQASNIFFNGVFNGDAHPGNILLLKDGKMGMIDYGQIKHMSLRQRIVYAKLTIALSRDDKEEVVRLYFDEMGTKTKYRSKDIAYLLVSFYNDRDTPEILGDRNISTFIDYCQSIDPMIQLADDYIFASRASLLLRGMGKAFGLKIRISQIWKDDAIEFLKSQGINY
jgi:aarF domain-containing kinase